MRAAIYTRISEDDGTALGVGRQEQDARAEAERRGWDVAEVYTDNDVSATRSSRRPAYERLLRDVRAGVVQAVLVWDIDRLTRTPREIEDVIDLADSTGLVLVNVTGGGDVGTDDGRMMLRIKASIARHEVDQMSKRLKRKYRENAQQGRPHGRPPYGFTRVGGVDVIDVEQAAVIRRAAGRLLAGESLRRIAADLNADGVPGPSVAWSSTTLRQALIRPVLAGLRVYRGETMGKATSEAILTEDQHARIVALLRDPARRSNYRGRAPIYLLSGLARCGRCGGAMRRQMGHTNTLADGRMKRQPPSYVCSVCHKVRRIQEPVDELVEALVLRRLSDPAMAAALFRDGDDASAREARDAIAAADARLATAADQFSEGTITGDQLGRISTRLRNDRALAEARLQTAQPDERLSRFVNAGDVARVWTDAPIEVKRAVVDALMVVTIMPSGPGRAFNPEDVAIAWRS